MVSQQKEETKKGKRSKYTGRSKYPLHPTTLSEPPIIQKKLEQRRKRKLQW